ncbi:MAG: hypothetical protein N3F11_07805 [Casimicrobiaceae bacterium]|nr:hypothetical protein [Casimicrobiaceae bacterium]
MSHPPPSKEQLLIAEVLGVSIAEDTYNVAAARLFDAVASAVGAKSARPSSDRQRAFADSIGLNVSRDSMRVASAKIRDALLAKNQRAIAEMNLQPGDKVVRLDQREFDGEGALKKEFVVSSIGSNGRVFFKGSNCQGEWPTKLRKISGLDLPPSSRTKVKEGKP